MVERSLFAIIDLLQVAKSIILYFIWRVGGYFLFKKFQIFEKKFNFNLLHLIFLLLNKPEKAVGTFRVSP